MMKRIQKHAYFIILIGIFYFFGVENLCAQGFRFGFGGSIISMESNYSAVPSFSKSGYSFSMGWQFNNNLALLLGATIIDKIKTDTTKNIFYPDDTAEFGIVDVSVHYYFAFDDDQQFFPWIGAGYAIENSYWDTYFYSVTTTGISVSIGAEYKIGWGFRLNTFYQHQITDGNDIYDYGTYQFNSDEMGVQINFLLDLR